MKIKEEDVFQLKNLAKALEKAEYPRLNGTQIVAFTRMFQWLAVFSSEAFKEFEGEKALATIKEAEPKDPIQNLDKPSKNSKSQKKAKKPNTKKPALVQPVKMTKLEVEKK